MGKTSARSSERVRLSWPWYELLRIDQVPEQLRLRLLSVRAFDLHGMLVDADVVDGAQLEPLIARLFEDERAEYLHVHFARPGCYAARVERV